MVHEETVDVFHCGSVVGFSRPAIFHKIPQLIRNIALRVPSTRSRRQLILDEPRVDDRSVAREVEERYFLCDALKYEHCE